MTFNCAHCGTENARPGWRALNWMARFCDQACYSASKSNATPARFWALTEAQPNGCLHWMGTIDSGGYGTLKVNGTARKAHRHAWILTNGDIPNGLRALHACDNRRCVNVAHLFLGTDSDNMRDMAQKGRAAGFSRRGERHPLVRLTDEQVREIRARYVNRGRYGNASALAREFGVSGNHIRGLAVGASRPDAGGELHPVRPMRKSRMGGYEIQRRRDGNLSAYRYVPEVL